MSIAPSYMVVRLMICNIRPMKRNIFFNNSTRITNRLLLNPEEAYLGHSCIKKEFRDLGLSPFLCQIRMQSAYWSGLRRFSVSHRKSNLSSKAENPAYGFIFMHDESMS